MPFQRPPDVPSHWPSCRDEFHGFSFRHPPEWRSTTERGRCVQLQAGPRELPEAPPEVDVFIQVRSLEGDFPDDYLITHTPPATSAPAGRRGVTYAERQELTVGALPALRARFESWGPVPNWGVEYAIRKAGEVLHVYASQPSPVIEEQFDAMVATLKW